MESNRDDLNASRWVDERLEALAPDTSWQPDLQQGLRRFREKRQHARGRRRRWMWLAAGATATCLTVMATPVTRAFAQRCVSACVSQSNLLLRALGTLSKRSSVVYVRPEDRKLAPDFTLTDASGAPVRLSDFRGRVVLLNFWATWCAPCRTEMPWFIEFQRSRGGRDFQVLGISLDEDGWKSVRPYIERGPVNYPVMLADGEVTRLYSGVSSLPTTMIIDKSGRIAATHVGLCSRSEYEGDIQTALNEP